MRVLSFIALFLSFTFIANAQSEKSLVKSLKPDGVHEVVIDFTADEINANPWDEGTFRIEISIESNMPIQVLEQLVKAGRYSLEGQTVDGKYMVTAPNIDKRVSVRGKDLEEKISIQVKTPGYYVLNNNALSLDGAMAARSTTEAQMKKMAVNNIDIMSTSLSTTLRGDVKLKLKTGDILIAGVELEIE